MNDVAWRDLETRGFVLIRSFLSEEEVRLCRADYAQQPVDPTNRNYGLSPASQKAEERLLDRVREMLALVRSRTNLRVDLPIGGSYFATGRGIKFSWHQDHESFFAIQNHYDYLNFYIPIVKPRTDKSNLTIVPFDALERESPALFRKVVRGGASRFLPLGSREMIFLDDPGSVHVMKADLDRIAHTPLLDPGDLLLLRGDVIHRTQDAETERVALSFRAASSETLVRRSRLVAGGLYKAVMMVNNVATYERMFRAFDETGESAVGMHELNEVMGRTTLSKPKRRREFVRYLLSQKRRERVLLRFLRSSLTSVLVGVAFLLYERSRRYLGGEASGRAGGHGSPGARP